MDGMDLTSPLPSIVDLIKETWPLFKARFWGLMAAAGLGGILTMIVAMIPFGAALLIWFGTGYSHWWLWALAGGLSVFVVLWGVSWTQVALLEVALGNSKDAISLYRESWKKLTPFSWACLLAFLSAIGGIYLFILPGVFLAFALSFVPFVFISENIGGLESLERSLFYVKDRWMGVSGRLVFVSLAAWIASKIPLLGLFSGILTFPFALVFTSLLFLHLKKTAGAPVSAYGRKLIFISFAGFFVPVLFAFRLAALWPLIHAQLFSQARTLLSSYQGMMGP